MNPSPPGSVAQRTAGPIGQLVHPAIRQASGRERTLFVFNPISGRKGRNARLLPNLRDFISSQRLDAELVISECPGHATALAREGVQKGFLRIAAVGGDGTVNEVAQALVGTPAVLAFVPSGSGNGLARHLGFRGVGTASLRLLSGDHGRVALIDTGSANGLPFFNAMGLGFDAEVSRRFNQITRRGLPSYLRAALAAFFKRENQCCVITGPDGREACDALLVAVANSDQYGNGACIAPGARVDDGMLDLIAVRPVGAVGAAFLTARLFFGNFDRSPRVLRRRGRRFVIDRPAPGWIHTDGESRTAASAVEVLSHPRSLRVLVPAHCRTAPLSGGDGFSLQLP